MIMPQKDWRDDLVHFLITAGTTGRAQSEIIARFQSRTKTGPITEHLESLRVEDKVQKFKLPTKGRGTVTWRATTKMLEKIK